MSRPSTSFNTSGKKDVDARHRRQVYAVCARQTTMAGHDEEHLAMTSKLFDLSGKVAIVTGGNGGIGLGMARGLARAGANVVIVGRNEAKSDAAVAELSQHGVEAISVAADVTDKAAVTAMVERTLRELCVFRGMVSTDFTAS